MPDTKNENKGQKTTTTESKVAPEKTLEATKPTTLDERLAQMDSKSNSAPAFSSIPSTDKKSAEAKQPEPEAAKKAPELIPEQKSFKKLAESPKSEPTPQPVVAKKPEPEEVVKKSEPAKVTDEEVLKRSGVLRAFVVGVVVGALLTSIFI